MTPLIDADILLHELGWSGEFKDKDTGEIVLFPFERVAELLDEKIRLICEDVRATTEPVLFITSSEWLTEQINKEKDRSGEEHINFSPVFRYEIAKTRPYKGTRNNPKPFHFYNLITYMRAKYNVVVSTDGLEADDMMGIAQCSAFEDSTIICSRDKDLRMIPGWHFSWECGGQKAIGPNFTDRIGGLFKEGDKLLGYGLKFFYYQMLTGDPVDTVPGLPGIGPAKAFELLKDLRTEEDIFKAVKNKYIEVMGKEIAKDYFLEQANLLWIKQKKDKGYVIPLT